MIGVQVTQNATLSKGVTDGIEDENRDNQQGKDVIGEASSQANIARKVKEGCDGSIDANPNTDPCIKGKEWNVEVLEDVDKTKRTRDGEGCTSWWNFWRAKNSRKCGNPNPMFLVFDRLGFARTLDISYMTVVMISTGPVDPTMIVGIPLKRAKQQPIQEVARMVSTAPMLFSVFLP